MSAEDSAEANFILERETEQLGNRVPLLCLYIPTPPTPDPLLGGGDKRSTPLARGGTQACVAQTRVLITYCTAAAAALARVAPR